MSTRMETASSWWAADAQRSWGSPPKALIPMTLSEDTRYRRVQTPGHVEKSPKADGSAAMAFQGIVVFGWTSIPRVAVSSRGQPSGGADGLWCAVFKSKLPLLFLSFFIPSSGSRMAAG